MAFADTTVFRKTEAGKAEVEARSQSLHHRYRRALIMVDGRKDLAEMSVLLRPGELDIVFPHLHERGLIEIVGEEELALDTERVAMVPAARDPLMFATIRASAIERVNKAFGEGADMIVGEIESCESADDMRIKLRDLEEVFAGVLGDNKGVELAREIGQLLLVLVPRQH
jgi:hypothetical protein